MFSFRSCLALFLSSALIATPALAVRTTTHKKAITSRSHGSRKAVKKSKKLHGQKVIDPNRVTEIQQALIREKYMSGEANGVWDSSTQAAMQKFQSDQGWQTRLIPDSRALKKLGLGPDYSTAINAKDSTFGAPPPVTTIPTQEAKGFQSASGVSVNQ
jgi:peptidoglycan hydrolase-like protein with peptidoglycan-binding domain